MLKPISRVRLSSEVANQIFAMIRDKKFVEGEKLLPERELAVVLGVSRTVIREALRSLETMGYIESKVGGGTFVKRITFENVISPLTSFLECNKKLIVELIEVRKALEIETAKLAAERLTDKTKKGIERALEKMKKEIESGKIGIEGDSAFHEAIAVAADNEALERILIMCRELLNYTRTATLNMDGQPELALDDHMAIAEAIFERDVEKSIKNMREHLDKAHQNVLENKKLG